MGIEFERKFRVGSDGWRQATTSVTLLRQGYFCAAGSDTTVRVRCFSDKAYLAVKGPRVGVARVEFEYTIPLADGEEMLRTLCGNRTLAKLRHTLPNDGLIWHVDEFQGSNSGLLLAEVELMCADQPLNIPSWVGEEVTGRLEFRNAVLAEMPGFLTARCDSGSAERACRRET